jgi:hypothetical protein
VGTIYKELEVTVPAQFAWEAVRDVGSIHLRLARGFVSDTSLDGSVRTVTFANGYVVQEQIITIDDFHRRLAYCSIGGKASHHNAYLQVHKLSDDACRIQWVTDLLPDSMESPLRQLVDAGSEAIRKTLEESYRGGK